MKHSAQTIETTVTGDAGTELGPFQVFYRGDERWHSSRPVCFRESLETALYAVPFVGWWEIKDSRGRVVASHSQGIAAELVPRPSLLARQILSTLPLIGKAHESVGEIEIETGAWSGVEDAAAPGGVRWTRLPDTKDRPKPNGAAARKWPKEWAARPPVSFEIMPRPHHPAISVTIRHSTGWLRVEDHRYLELRARPKLDQDGMPRWDLMVLNAKENGEPGETAKGTAVEGLGLEEFLELGSIGVAVREARDPTAPPKTWKPGVIRTATGDASGGGGAVGERVERLGWVRGYYGIDKRPVEMKGYGNWTYKQDRYHLTHLPSGCLIEHCRRRSTAERIADMLVEEVPELSGDRGGAAAAAVSELTGHRVLELLQAMKDEAGWQRDRSPV